MHGFGILMKVCKQLFLAALALAVFFVASPVSGQTAEPGALKVGQRVEVEYTPGGGRWLAASIIEIVNDGYAYKVAIAPNQGAAESQTNIHFRRVRAATASAPATPGTAAARPRAPTTPAIGRYACTESRYSASTGGYEYDGKGSFLLQAGGRYQYLGFERPSEGRYRVDSGKILFSGGHLDGGEATPIEDRAGRFYLTAPRTGSRWTCGITE